MGPLAHRAPPAQRACPYLELNYFGKDESPWFFGRFTERRSLITQVRTSRLTVLHADSGVGKSSLLRAGLTARLHELAEDDYRALGQALLTPVFFGNWRNDPLRDLKDAVARQSGSFATPPCDVLDLGDGRLVEVLRQAATELGATLLIILDQFEEHLGRVRAQRESGAFIAELTECLEDPTLDASFLIGVREDAFGKVDTLFQGRVSGERTNTHLSYLTYAAASDAIRLPVTDVYNRGRDPREHVEFEPGLVEAVLAQVYHRDDLREITRADGAAPTPSEGSGNDEIEAPFLQLVMTRLWEREVDENGSRTLRLETFEGDLGGAKQIVANHLQNALHGLSAAEIATAIALFDQLVTPSGTKLALTAADLAKKTERDPFMVETVLRGLDESRILRSVGAVRDGGEERYEIFHDRFTPPIQRLLIAQERERKEQALQSETSARREAQARALKEVELRAEAEHNAQRAEDNARTARSRVRWLACFAGLCVVLMVTAVILLLVVRSARNDARNSAAQAARASLNTLADSSLATRPDIALLLLLAARQHDAGSARAFNTDDRNIAALLQTAKTSGTIGVLHGHSDVIESVAFAPRNGTLASGSADKTIRLWHVTANNRSPLGPPLLTHGSVFGVAFSPNGRTLAAASFDHVQIWNVDEHRLTASLPSAPGHVQVYTSVAFSPTGGLIAIGTEDGHAILWDPESRTTRSIAVSATNQVKSLAISRNGDVLATAAGPSVELWSTSTGARLNQWSDPGDPTALAFSPTRDILAGVARNSMTFWTLASGSPSAAPPPSKSIVAPTSLLYSIAFSPDGRTVAAGGAGGAVLADAVTGRFEGALSGPHGALYGIAFNDSGTTLAAGGADRSIHLWGLQLPVSASSIPGGPLAEIGRVASVAVSPDRGDIIAGGALGTHGFIDFVREPGARGATPALIRVPEPVEHVALSPNGQEVAVASNAGMIQLRNAVSGALEESWDGTPMLTPPGASPVAPTPSGATVFSLAFLGDGSQLVSGGADGVVRVWHLHPLGRPTVLSPRDFGAVYAVAVNGTTVAAASADRSIHVWNLASGGPPETIPLDDSVFGLTFSPDGDRLAGAGADDTIRLWQRNRSGFYTIKSVLLGHVSLVRGVAFSPDGKTLASAGSDHSVRLWDVATGNEIGTPFTSDTQSVEGVAFSPNGKYVVSGSADGDVRQWTVPTLLSSTMLAQRVCSFVGAGLNTAEWKVYAPKIPYQKTCNRLTPPTPPTSATAR